MEERKNEWQTGPQSSIAPAATCRTKFGFGGAFSVGSVVFAPMRRPEGAPCYALAEITGIQACSGTATVSFANSEPGVDDVAVPLYMLVACPESALSVAVENLSFSASCNLRDASHEQHCVLKMVRGKRLLCNDDTCSDSKKGQRLRIDAAASPPPASSGIASSSLSLSTSSELVTEENWRTFHVTHTPSESVDAFYARAFRNVTRAVFSFFVSNWPTRQCRAVLCVFDVYSTLHRFQIYMTFRGHRLYLIDGTCDHYSFVARQCAFQNTASDMLWLCLLAEDVEDEDTTLDLLGNWLSLGQQQQQNDCDDSATASIAVSIVSFTEGVEERKVGDNSFDGNVYTAVNTLITALRTCVLVIACKLSHWAQGDELMATSLLSGRQLLSRKKTTLELIVPTSTWQLEFFSLLNDFGRSVISTDIENHQWSRSGKVEIPPQRHALFFLPLTLQAIACGNIFDRSLSDVLACFSGGIQLVEILKSKIMRKMSFFGEEAFPVFAAVRAVLEDVLPLQFEKYTARSCRVALVLSAGGKGSTRDGDVAAYINAVQQFLYPRHLFVLTFSEGQQTGTAALMNSTAWLENGGVLVLNYEDSFCRLSSLLEEASVVITCSRASASAIQIVGRGVTHIALYSEVEFADGPGYPWTLWRGQTAKDFPVSNAEGSVLAAAVMTGRCGTGSLPVLSMAAALLHRLGSPNGEGEAEVEGNDELSWGCRKGKVSKWTFFCRFVEQVLLCNCRAPSAMFSGRTAQP